jgi:hypothetical protein
MVLANAGSGLTTTIQAGVNNTASRVYTWPTNFGSAGAALTDAAGNGTLSWVVPAGGATGANPTASVGLAAVPGSLGTFMRSDGAPALSVAITPTWSGAHTFNANVTMGTPGPAGTTGTLRFANATNANVTTIQAGTAIAAQTYLLPTTVGTAGQALVLSTVSPNQLGWASPSASFAAPSANSVNISAPTAGAASTGIRSDATLQLSQAIAPTWTATHTFSATIDLPHTTGVGVGVITKAGGAFIHEGGTNCTWIGVGTASPSTTASNCVGIGQSAMAGPNPASGNVGIGTQALAAINGGTTNVGIGYQALQSLTTGANNVMIGGFALQTGTASSNVVAIGSSAGNSSTGSYNTFVGQAAGQFKTSGDSNTFVGQAAGYKFSSGANNLVLGSYQGIAAGDPISSCIILSDGVGNVPLDYAYTTATSGLVPIGAASTWTFRGSVKIASGNALQLGNTYVSGGTLTATGSITIKDAAGTTYRIPVLV